MDIGSTNGYPSAALSNFAPHPFIFDGVEIASMEGFLQSLKFKNSDMQKHVCTLVGRAAKFKGKDKNWYREQKLYWQGQEFKRDSKEYQILLNKAYNALYQQNEGFRKALEASKPGILTHSIGKTKENETVLTQSEFCGRLMKLRMGKLLAEE